ncbi:MAG: methylenetetrahydrofolate--tRNA-(uracil(54)-C(5))-methyltransferase (FADH(2)-oxidizing) TrmFO [Candidatus Krumholzibacteria bacterium]|jgi:methylenetetrahydrofolate--tRNA-(uracil-5-)-methyltransferase|nr:methylenetetrahydrofolate--tRNA-(uracil(54)-C(5))-methyltransferase (FADH(2)-oxidizing) TrmFO [Candidatus Krumholzibacteria bacterium]MDP6668790.1 methylenetetrahydrofolate--tRNA-(uracil(54)-C(5))-methyltransferase (FADH(2)-oxidizing) TrmFO [Candidatus Krumholzibacteria bacterium]MDP6797586.1 methylenetetrahydrofolate--tRNA-(uracil(54)-C(5))-methyltransferase (FADH(2)-oxidizing) TrmFO [Candidatus Krumholzibacteria bacterium]MDP7020917.1 methylenetetrahydrofolate--tRNA-(uracil(54)-C(5))-methyl
MKEVLIVGGGLAGAEAALYLSSRGIPVRLMEMKPEKHSPAHRLPGLAELVCSNSLKSRLPDTASGLFKEELRLLGSQLLPIAEDCSLPAGGALAVDPRVFSENVSRAVSEAGVLVVSEEAVEIPSGEWVVMASGPLSSEALSVSIEKHFGEDRLSFYDAIAPSVSRDSLDDEFLFEASRYGKGDPDYLNAGLNAGEYEALIQALLDADTFPSRSFEKGVPFFESCLPVEEIASRGNDTLRHGAFRPVGLIDPRTGERPWAVLQLRRENLEGSVWGLVGCQTKLKQGEQDRIFRMIPALRNAEFLRYGAMHRNFFLDFPSTLSPFQESFRRKGLFFAGQITGVEGYVESMGSGLLAARHIADRMEGRKAALPPRETLTASLLAFLVGQEAGKSQPMNVNFGLLPGLEKRVGKKSARKAAYCERSLEALEAWLKSR